MTLFRISSLALLFVGYAIAFAPTLHAGASNKSGNPFGNGTFFADSGTFSAIERSSNGFLGVIQFSTSSSNSSVSSLTNTGIATVYADGQQFSGAAFGSVSGSTIAATYIGNYSFGILVPTYTLDSNGVITSVTYSDKILSNTISGQLSATLRNTYPTQSFSGQGQTTIVLKDLNPDTLIISTTSKTYNPTVTGVRLTQ